MRKAKIGLFVVMILCIVVPITPLWLLLVELAIKKKVKRRAIKWRMLGINTVRVMVCCLMPARDAREFLRDIVASRRALF